MQPIHAAYVGSGTDVVPIILFSGTIQKFVQIESQPKSEFGLIEHPYFQRPQFLARFCAKMKGLGFRQVRHVPNNILFAKGQTEVSLWYSSALPWKDPHPSLLQELSFCKALFVCGHLPHQSILDYIQQNPVVVSNTQTVLTEMEDDEINFATCSGFYQIHSKQPYHFMNDWSDKTYFQVIRQNSYNDWSRAK